MIETDLPPFAGFYDAATDKPEPIQTWYNYKSFYLCCNRKIDRELRFR